LPHANHAGLSPERLAVIDRVLKEKYLDSGELPGTLLQIYRRGEVVHSTSSGMMDIERNKAMREDAIFRIYSMSKPITAVALMMLVEEGKIALYDDVADYIPSWKNLGVFLGGRLGAFQTKAPDRPMKVIDLATHTSGLTYSWKNNTNVDAAYDQLKLHHNDAPNGLDGMVDELSRLPLDFSPGTAWSYSIGMEVMGYLVQKLSGLSFGEFLRTRLFEPLGMNDTGFYVQAGKLDRLTSCYTPQPGE
jgi:CubicO group peptidase (beta-lactamase class C family)